MAKTQFIAPICVAINVTTLLKKTGVSVLLTVLLLLSILNMKNWVSFVTGVV